MRVEEVKDPEEAAHVLKLYLIRVPIVQPYFEVSPDAPDEAFKAEVSRHPVFRVLAPNDRGEPRR